MKLALVVAYYLSKYDKVALNKFNFTTYKGAFETIGTILNVKPNTIKNRRDDFDPLHNNRSGWYQRDLMPISQRIVDIFRDFSEDALTEVVKDILESNNFNLDIYLNGLSRVEEGTEFNHRAITGKRAEQLFIEYFQNNDIEGLNRGELIDRRDEGCGYDFELDSSPKMVYEIKGLAVERGAISFTDKEWETARKLRCQYVLVVVKDINHTPVFKVIVDPYINLNPNKRVQQTININWVVNSI